MSLYRPIHIETDPLVTGGFVTQYEGDDSSIGFVWVKKRVSGILTPSLIRLNIRGVVE